MSYHLLIIRDTYTDKSTTGKLYVNGKFFCHTLEDVDRPEGVKIPAKTAIPEGTYSVDVTKSSRFKRDMPIIFNQANGYELKNKGKSFNGIRLHGGNTHLNTEGCPLVAKSKINDDHIYGTMEVPLTQKLIELGRKGFITVVSDYK